MNKLLVCFFEAVTAMMRRDNVKIGEVFNLYQGLR